MHPNLSSQKSSALGLQPRSAWNAILALVLVTVALLLAGRGSIVGIIFQSTSLTVGVFLYRRYPVMYVSYSLWLWFLGHLVGRLFSYKLGYTIGGPASIGAVVSCLSFFTLIKRIPISIKNRDQVFFAFALCTSSILYSFCIRLILNPTPESIQREIVLITSTTGPLLLGFHLYVNWQNYPNLRSILQKTFLWSAIVMGGYGIFQFLVAPGWDTQWMIASEGDRESWSGKPEPLGIRVFSTMWDPYAFALNLMPSLILLISSRNKLSYIGLAVGFLSFLLSAYRTAWYSFAIAVLIFITSLKIQKQIRILSSLIVVVVIVFFLSTSQPFGSLISQRFSTFSSLEEDVSGQERIELFNQLFGISMSEFIGQGLNVGDIRIGDNPSSTIRFWNYDQGFLQLLLSMGWIGTLPYLSGIILLLSKLFWNRIAKVDMFVIAARAIVLGSLSRIFTSSILLGGFALPLWIFLGIGASAYRYHKTTLEIGGNQAKSG